MTTSRSSHTVANADIIKASLLSGQRARHTSTLGNVKIILSEKIVLLLDPHVDVLYSLVVT